MSHYNQQSQQPGYGYSDYPSHDYAQRYDAPPQESRASFDQHSGAYPPASPYKDPYVSATSDPFADYEPVGGAGNYGSSSSGANLAREKDNPYSAEYKGAGSNKKKWIIGGVVALVIIAIIAGIVGWRVSATKDDDSSNSSGSTSNGGSTKGMSYISGTANVVKSNPQDPSQFEKDSRLHQSFWGMCYTPFLAQEPWCGATSANVTEDIQQLSQLTTRIRMYGSACNQSALVLDAIDRTKVDMTVWLGVYIGSNETVNEEQKATTLSVLSKYGTDHVSGVTVGNEYLLNAVDKATAAQTILTHVSDFKSRLSALNLPKTIPVGTADAGSEIRADLVAGVDFFMANTHAFFGGLLISDAAAWVYNYFQDTDVVVTDAAPNKPTAYIAETGWPSGSMTAENATYEGAVAGVSELQTYLDTYVCAANTNGSHYFYFSPYDEPWKEQFGGVEPYWGIMDSNKKLKDLTLPTCQSP